MCGIAGYIGRRPPSDGAVEACLKSMERRGPDANAAIRRDLHEGWHVVLLHSRLSIIDCNHRADQPLARDGRVIAFNGEIYNYVELKRELQAAGDVFSTTSDTEVLLAGLNRFGPDWLDKAEGMWAFAYYDEASGQLLLSRDRFAEKPLYLLRTEDGLYFGSEVKFLWALSGHPPKVNLNHLKRYLVNGYKSLYKTEETFFQGIRELPHGRLLRLSPDAPPQETTFWRPNVVIDESMSWEQAVSGTRERLIDSIRLRLRADVPMAFCMSGGVDSNALVAIAKRVFNYDVHGFTVMNTDARYEERSVLDQVLAELNIRHTAIPVDPENFLDNLRTLIIQHDAPIYTISYYVHWLLMKEVAANGYRISVSGTAADELFTGYYDHHNAYLAEMSRSPRHAQALAEWREFVQPEVRNPHLGNPDLFTGNSDFRDHIYLNADEFALGLTQPWHESFTETRYTPGLLRNRMLNELFHEAVPVILHEDDINAMYYSVENRSPFLDRHLFDFAYSIPTRHLIRGGYAKAVLREAMRGIVPDCVIDNHRKVGFNAPIMDFLDLNDARTINEIFGDSPIYDVVNRDYIISMCRKNKLLNSESKFLFNFMCSKLFLDHNTA